MNPFKFILKISFQILSIVDMLFNFTNEYVFFRCNIISISKNTLVISFLTSKDAKGLFDFTLFEMFVCVASLLSVYTLNYSILYTFKTPYLYR